MSGRRATRQRPPAAPISVKVAPRRSPAARDRAAHRSPAVHRAELDRFGWLGPPPHALHLAGWATLLLRGFLGFTFLFAGLQKLADPSFFDPSNPSSIQAQLQAAARRSPVHAFVGSLTHVAIPLGILIALAELAVGIGTLLGLWTRLAAAGGIVISLMLFLTVSFHTHPYYTGSDIVFVFAWTPLLLSGSGGVLSADALLADRARRQQGLPADNVVPMSFSKVQRVCGSYSAGTCDARQAAPCEPVPCPFLAEFDSSRWKEPGLIDRRTLTVKGAWTAVAATLGLLGAGVAAAAGRLASHPQPGAKQAERLGPTSTTAARSSNASTGVSTTTPPTSTAPRPRGTRIGPASAVPVGGAATFQDPRSGDPSLVVQPSTGAFAAFDAVCPHAGCVVQFDTSNKAFVCPCHGSVFNGRTGDVEVGPAASGLTRLTIARGSDGQLYVD